jgi:alkylation response protein AidB-like acyl-CoA dehydrogenase
MEALTPREFTTPEAADGVAAEAVVDTFADLPAVDTSRWVASRKAAVLVAIADGRLSRAAACARYRISEAELRLWERAVECAGVPGLRVTRVQIYREVFDARGST